jgi:hypothetical protein
MRWRPNLQEKRKANIIVFLVKGCSLLFSLTITRILKKASDFLAFSSKLGHMEDLQQAFPISAQSPEFENDFLLYCNITMHVTHQSSCDH